MHVLKQHAQNRTKCSHSHCSVYFKCVFFVSIAVFRKDQITFKTQLYEKQQLFVCAFFTLAYSPRLLFHMYKLNVLTHLLYELSLRFRSNDIWCYLFVAFNNNSSSRIIKKTEFLAEHFKFVFIELTLFEVIHMNLLAIALSLSLMHSEWLFREFAYAFYWIESKKCTLCI